jgi:hypothetical protein
VPLNVGVPLILSVAVWTAVPIDTVELKIGLPLIVKSKPVTVLVKVPPLMLQLPEIAPLQTIEPPNAPPILVIVALNTPAFMVPTNPAPTAG